MTYFVSRGTLNPTYSLTLLLTYLCGGGVQTRDLSPVVYVSHQSDSHFLAVSLSICDVTGPTFCQSVRGRSPSSRTDFSRIEILLTSLKMNIFHPADVPKQFQLSALSGLLLYVQCSTFL